MPTGRCQRKLLSVLLLGCGHPDHNAGPVTRGQAVQVAPATVGAIQLAPTGAQPHCRQHLKFHRRHHKDDSVITAK